MKAFSLRSAAVAVLLLLVCGVVGGGARAQSPAPPALRHDVAVSVDPAARRLSATATTTLPPGFAGAFYLSAAYEIVEATASPAGKPSLTREGAWRRIVPPAGAASIRLSYRGPLPPFDPQGPVAPGAGPEGAFLPAGGGWTPDDFGPIPAAWRLAVEVNGPFVAVATGKREGEESGPNFYRGRFSEDRAVESPSLFIGPWTVTERAHNGVRYRAYLHPEQSGLAAGLIDAAAQAIDRYSVGVGPYPFADFSIISAPLPVGLGYPGLTYIGRQVLPLPFVRDRSLAHEALHNWWGNGVRIAPERGNWAEGLTTYMADHAVAELERPAAAAAIRLDWLRDFAALPPDREMGLRACRSKRHDAQQVICYGKAAMLFHMLRREIGDAAFGEGVRIFWKRRQFQSADWDDLRAAFETAAKRDLAGFFKQWIDRPGAPSLRLAEAVADGRKVTVKLQQLEPSWRLRVPLRVETEAGVESHVVDMSEAAQSVTVTVGAKPLKVQVDPEHDIFRRLETGETPLILRDFTLRRRVATLTLGGPAEREAAETLAAALFADDVAPVNAAAAAVGDEPLAVIGPSREVTEFLNRLGVKSPLAASARVTGRAWTGRTRSGRAILAAEANDAESLAGMARPLPHYRRESWITFNGRSVLGHGVWASGDGGLARVLDAAAK